MSLISLCAWGMAFAQEATAPAVGASSAPMPSGGAGPAPSPGGGMGMWVFLVGFVAIMYFLMIRPNQKREKERREMLAAVSKGDRVMTSGGIFGTVIGLTEQSVVLKVSDDPQVKMEFVRGAISRIMPRGEDKDK